MGQALVLPRNVKTQGQHVTLAHHTSLLLFFDSPYISVHKNNTLGTIDLRVLFSNQAAKPVVMCSEYGMNQLRRHGFAKAQQWLEKGQTQQGPVYSHDNEQYHFLQGYHGISAGVPVSTSFLISTTRIKTILYTDQHLLTSRHVLRLRQHQASVLVFLQFPMALLSPSPYQNESESQAVAYFQQ